MARKYDHPFIKEVIVRLDFTTGITPIAKSIPQKLNKTLLALFPIVEPRQFIGKELLITPTATKEKVLQGTSWLFHSSNKGKTLRISPDELDITYREYESFEILKSDFINVTEVLFSIYENLQGKRLGLRYVNEIILSENDLFNWSKYIDQRLLQMLEFSKDPREICRAFNNLEINREDFLVRFQYGMFNPDYPARIRRKYFILDYDAFYKGPQDSSDVRNRIDRLHEEIEALFERSIKDKLRNKMGVSENG